MHPNRDRASSLLCDRSIYSLYMKSPFWRQIFSKNITALTGKFSRFRCVYTTRSTSLDLQLIAWRLLMYLALVEKNITPAEKPLDYSYLQTHKY